MRLLLLIFGELAFADIEAVWDGLLLPFCLVLARNHSGDLLELESEVLADLLDVVLLLFLGVVPLRLYAPAVILHLSAG